MYNRHQEPIIEYMISPEEPFGLPLGFLKLNSTYDRKLDGES